MAKEELEIEMDINKIGEAIKECRRTEGKSLQSFRCINYTSLSKLENGISAPNLIKVRKIFQEIFPGQKLVFILR